MLLPNRSMRAVPPNRLLPGETSTDPERGRQPPGENAQIEVEVGGPKLDALGGPLFRRNAPKPLYTVPLRMVVKVVMEVLNDEAISLEGHMTLGVGVVLPSVIVTPLVEKVEAVVVCVFDV